ncbi:hypothetical protein ACHWQZ_G012015 [Mnemiopsis leidyi]
MTTLTEISMKESTAPSSHRGPKPVTLQPVDEADKPPRHVYRIKRSDYAKLPPIQVQPKGDRSICSRVDDDIFLGEHMLDIERYIKDLLPDLPSHPAALRATIRSPTVISEADLSLWRDGRGSKRGQVAALGKKRSQLPISCLYKLGQALLNEQQVNLNRDLLEKEVQIKRILEQHRPILLRSLRDWRVLGKNARVRGILEVEGVGRGAETPGGSFLGRCSTARDSALGDSGFGHWEGSNEQDTDYLPSQRTLVTGDQERTTALHSLSEKELKESSEDSPETESTETSTMQTESDGYADNEDDDDSSSEKEMTHLPFTFPTKALTSSSPTTMSTTPHQPTPASLPETKQKSVHIPSPEPDSDLTPTPQLKSRQSAQSAVPAISTVEEDHPSQGLETALSGKTSRTELSVNAPSEDILGINDMLEDTDEDRDGKGKSGDGDSDAEPETRWSSEASLSTTEDDDYVDSPPPVYVYKPKPKTPTPTPTPSPEPPAVPLKVPTPTPPPPPEPTPPPPVQRMKLAPPPRTNQLTFMEEDILKQMKEDAILERERAKQRALEKAREAEMEAEMEAYMNEEFSGDENLNEILRRFTIVDKGRLNYLNKIFHDFQTDTQNSYLSHQEMKKALTQIKSCTKITRNQLKFIETLLGLNKERISFHTFAVMATLIDHMSHKDPATLAMFDSIDLTRLQHDLPRLKRLFHCVSERDEFGWPKLTTKAMDIELRAACVPETTRTTIIKELDPQNVGEITIFDFILFTPFWIYLHDGIVDNPFREIEREVTSPVHRKWGVSVLWLPVVPQNARDPRASPASGCGSERSTPPAYIESPKMRTVQGEPDYSEEEDDTEGIVNSDDED